jgi:hypothetical protein
MFRNLSTSSLLVALSFAAACATPPTSPTGTSASGLAAGSTAARPGFVFPAGCCYYEGAMVRTVVPPAATPSEGRDDFFAIMNGVAGQKGVVAVAPGDVGYHGGHWKFYAVTFTGAPYLLTSAAEVHAAATAGHVTVQRVAENDFLCPIQK